MILSINLNLAIDKVLLVDEFSLHKENRVSVISSLPGGKGVNVARCLRSFNRTVTVSGFKGGYNGKFIEDGLIKEYIYPLLYEINKENRVCNIIVDKHNNVIEIYEVGPEISKEEGNGLLDLINKRIEQFNYIIISGSIPKGLDFNFFNNLISIIKNKKIFLDIKGEFLIKFLETSDTFFLKLNEDEFSNTFNIEKSEIINNLRDIKSKYKIKSICITLGEKGALFILDNKTYHIYSDFNVNVVNPVGAGDSFMGGFVFGITEGMSFLDSIKYGLSASISNVTLYEGGKVNFNIFYDILKNIYVKEV